MSGIDIKLSRSNYRKMRKRALKNKSTIDQEVHKILEKEFKDDENEK